MSKRNKKNKNNDDEGKIDVVLGIEPGQTLAVQQPRAMEPAAAARREEENRTLQLINSVLEDTAWYPLLEHPYAKWLVYVELEENDYLRTTDMSGRIVGKSAILFPSPAPWGGVPRETVGPVPTKYLIMQAKVKIMQFIIRMYGPWNIPIGVVNMTQFTTEALRMGKELPGRMSSLEIQLIKKSYDQVHIGEKLLNRLLVMSQSLNESRQHAEFLAAHAIELAHQWYERMRRLSKMGKEEGGKVTYGTIMKLGMIGLIALGSIYLVALLLGLR